MSSLVRKIVQNIPQPIRDIVPDQIKESYRHRNRQAAYYRDATIENIRATLESLQTTPLDELEKIRISRLQKTAKVPKEVSVIEINNNCNINCVMCRTKSSQLKQATMDLGYFEELVAQFAERGLTATNFHTIGDPLINARLGEYLKILRKYKVKLSRLSSNCQNLHRMQDVVLEYSDIITEFRPSLDAATKQTYEFIRAPGNWELLHENLVAFASENARLQRPIPVICNHAIMKCNFHEVAYIPAAYDYLTERAAHSFGFVHALPLAEDDFVRENYFDPEMTHISPCSQLWSNLNVNVDGSLSGCYLTGNRDVTYGQLEPEGAPAPTRRIDPLAMPAHTTVVKNFDNLNDAFNNDFMQNLRQAHLDRDVAAMPESCRRCQAVDDRYSLVINAVIQYFYLKIDRHPIYLQQALNRIGPMLKAHEFADIAKVVEDL